MGKWDDDITLRSAGSVQPTTVSSLLRSMRITNASDSTKIGAITSWLNSHTPSETLINSLNRGGYGYLVRHDVGKFSAPVDQDLSGDLRFG